MGKFFDRAALLTLAATALYLLFLRITSHPVPACVLSFAVCSLALKRLTGRANARMTLSDARAILRGWAYGPDEDARRNIARLMDEEESKIAYLPRHPAATVAMGDVFSAWKARKDQDAFLLAAPCRADGRAKAFAATLSSPAVILADSAVLTARIRRSRLTPPPRPSFKDRLTHLRATLLTLPERRSWRQNLRLGLILMALYLLLGNSMYLLLSILSLFLAGISARPSLT